MKRLSGLFAAIVFAAVCLITAASSKADTVTICAVSGHNGVEEVVSYCGAEQVGAQVDGFAAFCFADGNYIDGSILSVDVHPGGTSTVWIMGFFNDVDPVMVTLTITDSPLDAAGVEVDDAKVSILVVGASGVLERSDLGDNQYGWITRYK